MLRELSAGLRNQAFGSGGSSETVALGHPVIPVSDGFGVAFSTLRAEADSRFGVCNSWFTYSARRASTGFTFAARIDGTRLATTVTSARSPSLRTFLRYLLSEGHISASLIRAIPRVRRWHDATLPRTLSAEELDNVIAACQSPWAEHGANGPSFCS